MKENIAPRDNKPRQFDTAAIPIGIVGLGLMGCSITTCLLIAGHPVVALAPVHHDLAHAENRIRTHLTKSQQHGLVSERPEFYFQQLTITEDYSALKSCKLVVECTLEDMDIKGAVFRKIEEVVTPEALIGSNTSAIPISDLQKLIKHPERFFGLHWTEPANTTKFLEIICGESSKLAYGEYLYELSRYWAKEPILVKRDLRGFVGNRLMYAMYREAINLVENGYATIEDVDRACRNNTGFFMTYIGLFRWMDLTGLKAYHTVMKDLLPTLHNGTEVPKLIDDIVKAGGNGVSNAQGFYRYTPEEARMWEETFNQFAYDIRELSQKYPEDLVQKKLEQQEKKEE